MYCYKSIFNGTSINIVLLFLTGVHQQSRFVINSINGFHKICYL